MIHVLSTFMVLIEFYPGSIQIRTKVTRDDNDQRVVPYGCRCLFPELRINFEVRKKGHKQVQPIRMYIRHTLEGPFGRIHPPLCSIDEGRLIRVYAASSDQNSL